MTLRRMAEITVATMAVEHPEKMLSQEDDYYLHVLCATYERRGELNGYGLKAWENEFKIMDRLVAQEGITEE